MMRRTLQRTAIERILEEARRPLSPMEILAAARTELPSLSLATVYRNLKRLVEEEFLTPVVLPGSSARYELRQAADRHHHHFRCTACGAIFDLEGCVEGLRELLPAGFELTGHDILLTGLCTSCAR